MNYRVVPATPAPLRGDVNARTVRTSLLRTDENIEEKIALPFGNILIGSSEGLGEPMVVSGDATLGSSGIMTLSDVVTGGSYTYSNITVDSKGRVISASSGTLPDSVAPGGTEGSVQINQSGGFGGSSWTINGDTLTGTNLISDTISGKLILPEGNILIGSSNDLGEPITVSGDATLSTSGVMTLSDVTSGGSYNYSNITIDSKGRVTSASSGTLPDPITPGGTEGSIQINQGGEFGGSSWVINGNTLTGTDLISDTISGKLILPEGNILIGSPNDLSEPIVVSGDATLNSSGVMTLSDVVTGGSYTNASITIDSKGRVISANDGIGHPLTVTNDSNVTLTTTGETSVALLKNANIEVGWSGTLSPSRGGTGVSNTSELTLGDNDITFNTTGNTDITLPESGILATVDQIPTLIGTQDRINVTNNTVDISDNYSGQSSITNVGTLISGSLGSSFGLISSVIGGTGISTYEIGDFIYASATNVLSKLSGNATSAKRFLTQTLSIPGWNSIENSDIPGAQLTTTNDTNVTLSLSGTPGTSLLRSVNITSGWNGVLSSQRGGTGVNNVSKLTLGSHDTTFNTTDDTNITLPVSGIVATVDQIPIPSPKDVLVLMVLDPTPIDINRYTVISGYMTLRSVGNSMTHLDGKTTVHETGVYSISSSFCVSTEDPILFDAWISIFGSGSDNIYYAERHGLVQTYSERISNSAVLYLQANDVISITAHQTSVDVVYTDYYLMPSYLTIARLW